MPVSIESQIEMGHGTLVSLEGDAQLIATQLRLLPPCQKILILPPFLEQLTDSEAPDTLNPQSFVRYVHAAFADRVKTARDFLKPSTTLHSRLAFMNGGSAAAQEICISYIRDNHTNGNLEEAQQVFEDVVKNGVLGLNGDRSPYNQGATNHDDSSIWKFRGDNAGELHLDDYTSRAMRAAELLDSRTAALQDTPRVFTSVNFRHTNSGNARANDKISTNEIERQVTTINDHSSGDILTTVLTVSSAGKVGKVDPFNVKYTMDDRPLTPNFRRFSELHTEEENAEERNRNNSLSMASYRSDGSTPQTAIFGEARIVDIQSTTPGKTPTSLRKVMSVDFLAKEASSQGSGLGTKSLKHHKSEMMLRKKPATLENLLSYSDFTNARQSTIIRPSEVIITRRKTARSSSLPPTPNTATSYVDKGTDSLMKLELKATEVPQEELLSAEPVFPVVEDFVIHFARQSTDSLLSTIVACHQSSLNQDCLIESFPAAPSSAMAMDLRNENSTSDDGYHSSTLSPGWESSEDGEFDPDSYINRKWPIVYRLEVNENSPRPTVKLTAPQPHAEQTTSKLATIHVPEKWDVMEVQDEFRVLLNSRFAIGRDNEHREVSGTLLPITTRAWKPVFGEVDERDSGKKSVDQIIAIGSEKGVKHDFSSLISGQVERLGMKRDGSSRSGRLDLRYLIGNVMQILSNLPLQPAPYDLLADPALLASYLVPHLEAYLAANHSVRLLILLYPADHLATMIALRGLLGEGLFKVAGIVDSHLVKQSEPSPPNTATQSSSDEGITFPKPPSVVVRLRSRTNSSFTINSTGTPMIPQPTQSFAKADYLLPSMATDTEIVAFLSAIWTSLMQTSTYYTPEPEPAPVIVEKVVERYIDRPVICPPTPPYLPVPDPTLSRPTTAVHSSSSKLARLTGATPNMQNQNQNQNFTPTQTYAEKKRHSHSPSVASTTMTMRTTTSRRWRAKEDGESGGYENFYVDEEDSEEDEYDRMVLGRAGARPVRKEPVGGKGDAGTDMGTGTASKKKALKWLGLA